MLHSIPIYPGGIKLRLINDALKTFTYKKRFIFLILAVCCIASIIFVSHNEILYNRPIAKVVQTKVTDTEHVKDSRHNKDILSTQHITAVLKNGKDKSRPVRITNQYSLSKAYDQRYRTGDKVFVTIDKSKKGSVLSGSIQDVKRDTYIVIAGWIFFFILLIVGRRQGLFSASAL
jgi:uncharacterized membrane protein